MNIKVPFQLSSWVYKQRQCVYWFFFLWTSSLALHCSSIVFWLPPVFLSFYYYLTCATLFIPFLWFESIKSPLYEIHMLILLEVVVSEWRNLSWFLNTVVVSNSNFSVSLGLFITLKPAVHSKLVQILQNSNCSHHPALLQSTSCFSWKHSFLLWCFLFYNTCSTSEVKLP